MISVKNHITHLQEKSKVEVGVGGGARRKFMYDNNTDCFTLAILALSCMHCSYHYSTLTLSPDHTQLFNVHYAPYVLHACMYALQLASYRCPGPGREARRGRGKSGLVSNICACAEITKKTGNRILSVNSSYYGTVYVHL